MLLKSKLVHFFFSMKRILISGLKVHGPNMGGGRAVLGEEKN
jgi:hypothetical protein